MNEKKPIESGCANCSVEPDTRACKKAKGAGAKGCPTLTRQELLKKANAEYLKPAMESFARQASIQEASCYANRHERPYISQPLPGWRFFARLPQGQSRNAHREVSEK